MDVWIWIAIVFLILLIGISVGVFVYYKVKETGGGNDGPKCNQSQMSSNCLYYQEKYADSSITTPTQQLYLGQFTYSQGAGDALCQPMWYAFRYVRQSDGGYSALSPWIQSPVFAGACTLPCAPSVCGTPQVPPNGRPQDSVTYNAPTIVTVSPLDYPLDLLSSSGATYVANVHRYVGVTPPSATEEGTIIGMLEPQPQPNPNGFTAVIPDVFSNPGSGASTCNPQTCT